jgi:parvulin-like peptidyl-prolyl isomerase
LANSLSETAVRAVLTQHGRSKNDRVLARVNGEPIYASDVNRGIPPDAMENAAAQMRQSRLAQLVQKAETRQFLRAQHALITEREIDQAVAEMEKNPPSKGCACCRYSSLDAYLAQSGMTYDDLRDDILVQKGTERYLTAEWSRKYPDAKSQSKLIAAARKRTEQEYTRAWHIFFNTFQQVGAQKDPAEVDRTARRHADAAWQRLQHGESFAAVAKDVSEDQTSRSEGGALGSIRKNAYGKEFEATLGTLKPGEVSQPIKSPYGYHILKWEPLVSDRELVRIAQQEFIANERLKLYERIQKSATVERGSATQRASAAP